MLNINVFPDASAQIDYEKELGANSDFLVQGAKILDGYLKKAGAQISASNNLSQVRSADLLNSATQDIIRYALYHPVAKDKNGLFRISESVRAAYLTKWIMIFKPLNIDQDLTEAPKI